MIKSKHALSLLAGIALVAPSAHSITVDQIIAPGDVDASKLSGTVNMVANGTKLTITMVNTSLDAAGSGAGVLLTGIGFKLTGGITILSGKATIAAGAGVGFSATDVSSEWGYDNSPLQSGALAALATGGINTAVSSMESQATDQFAPGSIASPPNLDGPDFGLVSALEADPLGAGVEAIKGTITIELLLSGEVDVDDIDKGWVVLSFGSPGSGGSPSVPDAGSTMALLGMGLGAFSWMARKRKA